jgi:hypothetical protein
MEYFEARVLGGLRVSPLDLGRGGTANRACYSGDTETLTDKGWKHHWDIDLDSDLIATVHPDTLALEFHKAESKHVYPFSGTLLNFKTRMTDSLVTDDHDMWVARGGKWAKEKASRLAEEMELTKPDFLLKAKWEEQGKELGDTVIGKHKGIPPGVWLRLIAYFIRYGKVTPSRNEMKLIVRSKETTAAIKGFIEELPFEFRVYDNGDYAKFAVNDIDLVKHLSMNCSCRTYPKRIPSYIVESSPKDLRRFLDDLIPSDPLDGTLIYYSRTFGLAGQVQEIAFKLGHCTKLLDDTKHPRVVIMQGGDTDELTEQPEEVPYEGDVYCFSVPNHLFVTRRNGKISIHGNTAGTINKNIQDASKDYQQAFSIAISYNLFLPLLLEGGFNINSDNMVFLTFPMIDREEMRAQQNHGEQLMLSNSITNEEFRKDFLGKPPLTDEQIKNTTRELDAVIDERLARIVGSFKATTSTSSTAKKSTSTAKKSTSNRGQPRNQSGTKPAKTRAKANDYLTVVRGEFGRFKEKMIQLVESDQDEVDSDLLESSIKKLHTALVNDCSAHAHRYLSDYVDLGVDMALSQDDSDGDKDLVVGRRALQKFTTNYIKQSYWRAISPYMDQICRYVELDAEGNSPRYKVYGSLSSLKLSLDRLIRDQEETAKRFGFAKAARILGYVNVSIEDAETSERKTIELNKGPIRYRNLIPGLDESDSEMKLGSKLIEDTSDDGDNTD